MKIKPTHRCRKYKEQRQNVITLFCTLLVVTSAFCFVSIKFIEEFVDTYHHLPATTVEAQEYPPGEVPLINEHGEHEDTEGVITRISTHLGVDPKVMIALAKCESSLNPQATGTNKDGSKDRGLYQVNARWHREVSDKVAYDAELSTVWAAWMVKQGQGGQWTCWDKIAH